MQDDAQKPTKLSTITHTLRFRLTAWFSGILSLLLAILCIFIYLAARHGLIAETDAYLINVVRNLDSRQADEPSDDHKLSELLEAVNGDSFSPDKNPNHTTDDSGILHGMLLFDVVYIRLIDSNNHSTMAISPNLAGQKDLISSLDIISSRINPSSTPSFVYVEPGEELSMRVFSEVLHFQNAFVILQVAVPWDHNTDVLERLTVVLMLTFLVVIVVASVGGWILVGRTLKPIDLIVTEAKRFDVNTLPEKLLPMPDDNDSEIGHLVVTLNDLTTRLHKTFEAQKRFAEAQQRFAADASHELRTPLTILRGEMELALTRPRAADEYRATLQSGIEEIGRMCSIVEELSFLARNDIKQINPDKERRINLTVLLNDVVSSFQPQVQTKSIVLENKISCDAEFLIRGNEVQLIQLFRNIIDNAVKYTDVDGLITISLDFDMGVNGESCCTVTITDTGCGIAEEDAPHVFERFWRADRSRSSHGTGLGLSICRQIAMLHNGNITLDSRIGEGTMVTVELPYDAMSDQQ